MLFRSMRHAPLPERLDAVRTLAAAASRELLMRAATATDVSDHAFEAIATIIAERWTIDTLVQDAEDHRSPRDKWRRITALRILARLEHPRTGDLLRRALDARDAEVSACALAVLGRSLDPGAGLQLVAALAQPGLAASRVAVHIDQSPQDLRAPLAAHLDHPAATVDRKSTRLNSSHRT